MSELHAVLGHHGLKRVEENVRLRNAIRVRYEERFSSLPGLSFQKIRQGSRSTCKDFSVLIDPETFGLSRDFLCEALSKENVETKKYFYPPLHAQTLYRCFYRPKADPLSVTERISSRVLSFPIYSALSTSDVDAIVHVVEKIQRHTSKLSAQEQAHLLEAPWPATAS
jgi:dTDP-4-amino-4,6-dideoxygalactose transaminase